MKYYFRNFTFLILILLSICSKAAIHNNLDDLHKNANAIVKYSISELVIKSPTEATYKVKYSITVLNSKGDGFADLVVSYDKFSRIEGIKGRVYDSFGTEIKKIKSKDINDQSITSGGTIYDDSRVKYVEIFQSKYPYTVEYEYTKYFYGFVTFPEWSPIPHFNIAVEKSEYIVKTNSSYKFHYKAINFHDDPEISIIKNEKTYKWSIKNIEAIKAEPYRSHFNEISPIVYFAPYEFYYDGYYGTQKNWEEYGKWVYKLLKGRDQLSEETKLKINDLVKNVEDPIDKTRLIYEYMQSKTRYVSIQLGIGGFQPFSALEVDKLGYGDCKALCNYTKALLNEIGINSIYAEVHGDSFKKKFYPDFPGVNQTNHIILCVPFKNDTIWLECTDQKQPFGFLGSFTHDRYSLLIKPSGGELVKTTSYSMEENFRKRKVEAVLNSDCSLNAKVNTTYASIQYDNVSNQFSKSKEKQRKKLFEELDINNFQIFDFKYSQTKSINPEATEYIDLKINNYTSISGKRMFLPLNILNKQSYIPKKVSDRKSEIVLNYPYSDTDTIVFNIPEKYTIEYLPNELHIKNEFGEYNTYIIQEENKIKYIRIFNRNSGRFPKDKYPDLIEFFKEINRADNCKAILIEK